MIKFVRDSWIVYTVAKCIVPSFPGALKMTDIKVARHEIAGHEIARHDKFQISIMMFLPVPVI